MTHGSNLLIIIDKFVICGKNEKGEDVDCNCPAQNRIQAAQLEDYEITTIPENLEKSYCKYSIDQLITLGISGSAYPKSAP